MSAIQTRRSFLGRAAAAGATAAATATFSGCGTAQKPAGPKRPNILFIFADDWSYPHAGAYGDEGVKTPTFDRLAREGVLFTHCYCAAPSCTPSRSTVLSGRQLYGTGEAGTLFGSIPPSLPLYTHLLEDAGYHVGFTGKGWGPGNASALGQERSPTGKAFNDKRHVGELREGLNPIDYAANFGDFLDVRPEGAPFCFWLGTSEPHRIYQRGAGLALGKRLTDAKVPPYWPDVEEIRSDILDYYTEVEWCDQQAGKVLQRLEMAGELENTIIVMTSDNGMPFPRAKATLYDSGTRMPLAIRWGSATAGRVVNDFVSHTDFAVTFIEAAGLPAVPSATGKSLLPILKSTKQGIVDPDRDHAVSAFERHTLCRPDKATYPMRALRTRDYMYIRNFEPDRWPTGGPDFVGNTNQPHGDVDGSPTKTFITDQTNRAAYPLLYELNFGKRPAEELYDVRSDPHMMVNLAGRPSAQTALARHRDRLELILRGEGDPRIEGQDPWQSYTYYGRQTATDPPAPAKTKP